MQRFKTYGYMVRLREWGFHRTYTALQWLCEKIIGHAWLDTDWGYGGGDRVDVWCKYCNKMGSIPFDEAEKIFPPMRGWVQGIMGREPPFAMLRPVAKQSLEATEE